jgi:hypothetical protein
LHQVPGSADTHWSMSSPLHKLVAGPLVMEDSVDPLKAEIHDERDATADREVE